MLFRMIEQARRSDDPSLPMGAWVTEPKRANWPKVSSLIAGALADTAKDLLLASWLLEAEIHQRGFAAIAPGIALMHGLCERWWVGLHPEGEGADHESRANIVRWVDEKLLPAVSLVPLAEQGERSASWSHWELAHHYERIRAAKGELPEEARNSPGLDELHALLAMAPVDALRARHGELAAARAAIAAFERALRRRFASEAPALGRLDALLARAQVPLHGELMRRGQPLQAVTAVPDAADAPSVIPQPDAAQSDIADGAPLTERERAYRMLEEIAGYLAHIEPHSPVPYLLRRAVAWGALNTAELYRELFVVGNAQISLFELLGLGAAAQSGATE
jgi:type VI secretion system ImpA family protein